MLRTIPVACSAVDASNRLTEEEITVDDDAALVGALKAGDRQASVALLERYGNHVQRVLINVLGPDPEFTDVLHEVFARALAGIRGLRDGRRLKAWISRIAANTAREHIRSRSRRRRLLRSVSQELPAADYSLPQEVREAVRGCYAILDQLSADLRIAFALRFFCDMELKEVASACDVSMATIKRRLARAEARFFRLAGREPALLPYLQRGSRWRGA